MRLRAQSARRTRADDERADHHRAREGRRGPRAQARAQPGDHRRASSSTTAPRWSSISTSARCSSRRTRAPGGKIMNIREEDIPEVREESFRYPGPRPQTRECAIISLADSIESASRSLEKRHAAEDRSARRRHHREAAARWAAQGMRPDAARTRGTVGESFKHTLQSMMHSRVAYPTDKETKRETPAPPTRIPNAPPISAA